MSVCHKTNQAEGKLSNSLLLFTLQGWRFNILIPVISNRGAEVNHLSMTICSVRGVVGLEAFPSQTPLLQYVSLVEFTPPDGLWNGGMTTGKRTLDSECPSWRTIAYMLSLSFPKVDMCDMDWRVTEG